MAARVFIASAVAAALSGAAFLMLRQAGPVEIPYREADRIAEGAVLYAEHCAICHGADLGGEPGWDTPDAEGYYPAPPQDERGHAWHHPDALLYDIVKHGPERVVGNGYKSRMPGFEDILSDAEILSVLAHIKSTWPLVIVEAHAAVNGRPSNSPLDLETLEACGLSLGGALARRED